MGSWHCRSKFSMELDSTDCSISFGEIRFLKWRNINSSNSWFLAILNGFSEGCLYQTNIFFLKIKQYLNKNRYFMCQILTSDSYTHNLRQYDADCGKIRYVSDP